MQRCARVFPLALLAMALSGPALAQDSGQGAGRERPAANPSRSWADEVRSAVGSRGNGQGGDGGQAGKGAPVRSEMQTGSTGKSGPGPEKK
jgi:hypothetical protein